MYYFVEQGQARCATHSATQDGNTPFCRGKQAVLELRERGHALHNAAAIMLETDGFDEIVFENADMKLYASVETREDLHVLDEESITDLSDWEGPCAYVDLVTLPATRTGLCGVPSEYLEPSWTSSTPC